MMRVREHVNGCAHCSSLVSELRVVDALLATSRPVELAPNFTFAVMAEARGVEIAKANRRPLWPVLTGYIVTAWIALAGCFVVFGPRAGAVTAAFASVGTQLRTAFSVVGHSFGPSGPAVVGSVVLVLAIDAVCASAAIYFYRRARSRALRSEAS
jgi:hypothetical protein